VRILGQCPASLRKPFLDPFLYRPYPVADVPQPGAIRWCCAIISLGLYTPVSVA
jgi:hypothetical protein